MKSIRRWWGVPPDDSSLPRAHRMPATLFRFVFRTSAASQLWLTILAIAVFLLNTAPLEMQRRMLNAAMIDRDFNVVLGLALGYIAIVIAEGAIKLLMNVYRGWIGERTARVLRLTANERVAAMPSEGRSSAINGVGISLIIEESDPIGGFVGTSVSELVLQLGILVSVFGYMLYVQPLMAAVCFGIFTPQLVFVPLMQAAINRRVRERIVVLRETSTAVLVEQTAEVQRRLMQELRFAEIFELNIGIVKIRYSMKFLINLTHSLGKAVVLAVGGWYIVTGVVQIGTVVAFLSGLNNVREPWNELVNWYQDMMVTDAKYRTFVAALANFGASAGAAKAMQGAG